MDCLLDAEIDHVHNYQLNTAAGLKLLSMVFVKHPFGGSPFVPPWLGNEGLHDG